MSFANAGIARCRASLLAAAALLATTLTAHAQLGLQSSETSPAADDALLALVNAELGLDHSELVSLDVSPTPGVEQTIAIPIAGREWAVRFAPHSVRAPGYQVLAQVADGSYVPVEPGVIRTLAGEVIENPGSRAAGSLLDDGLYATVVFADGSQWWIEPLAGRFAGAVGGQYVLYPADAPNRIGGACATDESVFAGDDVQTGSGDDGGIAGGTQYTTELACDADREYYNAYGSSVPNVEARINSVVNLVNNQYTTQCDINHQITTIIVRTAEPDPYSSNDSNTLLTQFRSHWINNQSGVTRDVAKLFTGRSINGGIIGQAWAIGGICTDSGYCYSWSDCCGSTACATDLCAHELGHLWAATHCTCSNPAFTMNPFITCANVFNTGSINQIVGHRNSRTCLSTGGGGPANNACASATAVGNGSFNFDTTGASTDGPDEPSACNFFGYTQVGNDIWYRYTAPCTGNVTIDLCNSTFDTKVAVYGANCPTTASAIACNDDACGTDGIRSQLVFAATAGSQYRIRIGGYNGLTGTGTMTITGPTGAPTITLQPQSQSACVNDSVSFSVLASGSGTLTYQWRRNTVNIGGATSSTLTINPVLAGSAGSYDCVVTDACGSATSNAATLTVTSGPSITTQPQNQTACTGGSATFTVVASGPAPLTYQWQKNTVNIGGATGSTFTINNVAAGDAANYRVIVTNSCDSVTSNSVTLTVNTSVTIGVQPASDDVCVGESVTFTVGAFGTNPLAYQWQKNLVNIPGANTPGYTIAAAVAGDAGNYRCVVTNVCGSVNSNTATLTVSTAAGIAAQPQPQTVCAGNPASFSVTASGSAPFTYQWQKNTVNIAGATGSTYTIPATAAGDAGSYRVIVNNNCGSVTSSAVALTVNSGPSIGTQPSGATVCIGDPISLSVTAGGTAPLSYQWQKNTIDIPGATGASYTIAAAAAGDGGSYRVRVSNLCGSIFSNAATVTVEDCSCPGALADANCDGTVDFFDIDPFLQALFDPPAYQAAFCGGSFCATDTNCDGGVDFFDIDPFINCVFSGCEPCP